MGFGQGKWLRATLLSAVVALGASGCVSTYGYRDGNGGDYYYADPSIDGYYDDGPYGPYGDFGYRYPGGWYGSIGYGYGYGSGSYRYGTPYRYGYPYGYPYGGYYGYGNGYYGGYPYFYYPYAPRRHHPRPNPNTNPPPPGGVVEHRPPGPGPGPGLEDRDPDGGPWRNLDRVKRRIKTPMPSVAHREPLPSETMVEPQSGEARQPTYAPQPGFEPREPGPAEYRRRVAMPQPRNEAPRPEYREPRPMPAPRVESRRQDYEAPRPAPMGGGGRRGMQEREVGLDPAP